MAKGKNTIQYNISRRHEFNNWSSGHKWKKNYKTCYKKWPGVKRNRNNNCAYCAQIISSKQNKF